MWLRFYIKAIPAIVALMLIVMAGGHYVIPAVTAATHEPGGGRTL